eukprot:352444-Chlamydomonas_euryale.AAC.6
MEDLRKEAVRGRKPAWGWRRVKKGAAGATVDRTQRWMVVSGSDCRPDEGGCAVGGTVEGGGRPHGQVQTRRGPQKRCIEQNGGNAGPTHAVECADQPEASYTECGWKLVAV